MQNSTFDLEKEKEIEINLKELLYRKFDNNYYITFNKFDENRVTIKFKDNNDNKDNKIMEGYPIYINNDNNSNINFTFILNNNSIFENNLIVVCKISIEDAYYDICSIELKIKNNDELNKCLLNNLDKDLKEEFIDEIINDVLSHIESPDIINCSDFMAIVFDINYENPKEQLNNGISAIDLGNCTNKIKEFYNIEDFIVLNIESKNNKNENENNNYIGKNNQIEIYNYTGKKLNLSICDENIKIMKYIGDIDEKIIESAKKFASQGIDIFNPKDKFFNDLCYYYDNKDGKDILIKDRRNDIYQNITFCQDGCKYIGFDYELMIVNCSCDTNILENDDLNNIKEDESEIFNFDYLKKLFISNLFDFNYQVIYCYNLVFNLKILRKNIGFYTMIIMLFLQILFWIIYMIKGLDSIKQYMFNLYDKNGKNNLVYIKNNNNKIKKEIDEMNSKELKNDISINKNKHLKENIDNSSILKGINKNIKIDENKKITMLNNMNNINFEKEIFKKSAKK